MAITRKDIVLLGEIFVTKEDFAKHRSELIDKLDGILKEILASREEQTVLAHQVSGHEDRIMTLEEKVGITTP